MRDKVAECRYPERNNCRDCFYSYDPDRYDGGCTLIPATDKQMEYAESIAEELGIDLPEEHTMREISMFIDDNKDYFYQSRRERLGGYGEMYDRIDRRSL